MDNYINLQDGVNLHLASLQFSLTGVQSFAIESALI